MMNLKIFDKRSAVINLTTLICEVVSNKGKKQKLLGNKHKNNEMK